MRFKILCAILFALPAYGQIFTVGGSDPRTALFANLGTPTDGKWRFCSDCTATAPCAGSGTGAFAYRVGAVWNCNTGSGGGLTTDGATVGGTTTRQAFQNGISLGNNGVVTGSIQFFDGTAASTKFQAISVSAFPTGNRQLFWDTSLFTANRTWIWPNVSDTFVGLAATQTLTNKTMTDAATGGATPAVSNTTANSCGTTAASIVGNNTTGVITVGATAGTNCTITFTVAAPTRRQCTVTNETTANLSRSTYLTTTTSTVEGTFAAGDQISYVCAVY